MAFQDYPHAGRVFKCPPDVGEEAAQAAKDFFKAAERGFSCRVTPAVGNPLNNAQHEGDHEGVLTD